MGLHLNKDHCDIFYYGRRHVVFRFPSAPAPTSSAGPFVTRVRMNSGVDIGHVLLTRVGSELAPISGSMPDEGYREAVVADWRSMGFGVEECAPVEGEEFAES